MIFQVGLHPSKDFINRKVIQETNDYGDVLLQDFYEHYTNLSVKSVMILKYFRETLKIKPDFLFKVIIKVLSKYFSVISRDFYNFDFYRQNVKKISGRSLLNRQGGFSKRNSDRKSKLLRALIDSNATPKNLCMHFQWKMWMLKIFRIVLYRQ